MVGPNESLKEIVWRSVNASSPALVVADASIDRGVILGCTQVIFGLCVRENVSFIQFRLSSAIEYETAHKRECNERDGLAQMMSKTRLETDARSPWQ